MSITITLPLFVTLPRKTKADKRIYLSQNVWLVTHHRVRTQVKELVRQVIRPQLASAERLEGQISVSMELWTSNMNCDLGNFCDVLSKICQDCVVAEDFMEDDTVKYIARETRSFSGVDKLNPRLVITYST